MKATRRSSALWLLAAVAGYVIWSLAFVILYSFQGFACAKALDATPFFGVNLATAILLVIWAAHLVAGGALVVYARHTRGTIPRRPGAADVSRFLADMTCLLALAGIVSTLYVGAPLLFLDPCH